MPGYSWGLLATLCQTGGQLRTAPDSPCAKCYALKSRYLWPTVHGALQRNYQEWRTATDWPERMVRSIRATVTIGVPYFRWFDSGDLQSPKHLEQIVWIAQQLPEVSFWLPTQERRWVRAYLRRHGAFPTNLVVRISAPTLSGPRSTESAHASLVLRKPLKKRWASRVARSTPARWYCPAPIQQNQCGECRACWNPDILTVAYLEH